MNICVHPVKQACGAAITNVDLRKPLLIEEVDEIRTAWLQYHVVSFPGQKMSDDDLERFSLYFGRFGDDPFIDSIDGRVHIIALQRLAQEQAPLFAENWHTDWSFQEVPPSATCLFSLVIPPCGGDTLYANQHKALDEMPDSLRTRLEGKYAIHSARGGYAPDGLYGDADKASDRSMNIKPSKQALLTQLHPLIRKHPETGREGIYGCQGYIIGIEDMDEAEGRSLLQALHDWQTRSQFQYRHHWEKDMLVMWDNRSVLHRATGGYEGHDRLLHRTTIAGN